MDFIERLQQLSAQIIKQRDNISTEEATKTALVMPFIAALGYDVFNVVEVNPEFIADVGTKKGEKVDYAIMQDGKPIILIECKSIGTDLKKVHASQLYRYFTTTETRFAILTNGIEYHFFTDLDRSNVMDDKPFLVIDMSQVNERTALQLKKFTKAAFNIDEIISTASDLKYRHAIITIMNDQLKEPSEEFVRFLANQIYSGRLTQAVIKEFKDITRNALVAFVIEKVDERLKSALDSGTVTATLVEPEEVKEDEPEGEEKQIVTTQEELDGYFVVKSILREIVDPKRITMRDTQSYCGILLDDNNRKPICRLHFNRSQKYVGLFNSDKNEERISINDIDDIYTLADRLKETVSHYLS